MAKVDLAIKLTLIKYWNRTHGMPRWLLGQTRDNYSPSLFISDLNSVVALRKANLTTEQFASVWWLYCVFYSSCLAKVQRLKELPRNNHLKRPQDRHQFCKEAKGNSYPRSKRHFGNEFSFFTLLNHICIWYLFPLMFYSGKYLQR